jgi:UDP-2,3-diacylglucosamine pyrophosphatase LpxH
MTKYAMLTDVHFGFERRSGHKVALHDPRAFAVAHQFLQDFKPDVLILGGDILDCGVISHHNHGKPGRTEGFRLLSDAKECVQEILNPLEALKAKKQVYITGNHEDWLTDLTDLEPALGGIVDLKTILNLGNRWELVEQGGYYNLGKLTFIHGDQLSGGEHVAKAAVTTYEKSIRFGHFHTAQMFTKTSPIDTKFAKTGVAVPCLCTRSPNYTAGRPNRWTQGFQWGYVFPDGCYSDYTTIIVNGRTVVNGKIYKA